MQDQENVVTGTAPESADVKPTTPPAEQATSTGEVKPDAQEGQEKPKEIKADPVQAKLSYLQRELRRQSRANEQLMDRLLQTQNRQTQPEQAPTAPKLSDFNSVEDYVAATYKHLKSLEAQESKKESRPDPNTERYIQVIQSAREDLMTVGAEKYENFEEVVSDESVKISPAMRDAIFDIDDLDTQADVTWYLAQNPKEAVKISKLSPARQIKEIDRLEAKLKAKPVKKVSAAPEPIEPVGGANTKSDPLSAAKTDEEWIRARDEQVRKRRRG